MGELESFWAEVRVEHEPEAQPVVLHFDTGPEPELGWAWIGVFHGDRELVSVPRARVPLVIGEEGMTARFKAAETVTCDGFGVWLNRHDTCPPFSRTKCHPLSMTPGDTINVDVRILDESGHMEYLLRYFRGRNR